MVLLTTQSVAKRLNLTPDAVRHLERTGRLLAIKVERGSGQMQRLFLEADVVRCLARREAQQRAKQAKTLAESTARPKRQRPTRRES
jgi:hypothetical protein